VALDRTKVTLTPDQPFAVVLVDNAGDGPLAWGAHTVDPTIARTALPAGDTRGPGLLLIGPGRGVDLATDRFSTRVAVVDASGTTPDHAVVEVTVGTGEPSGDPATPAPGGSPDPAEDGTAAAPAGGGGGVPWVPVLLVLAAGTLGYAGRDRLRALRSRHRR
jgi:hypothetical protein